MLKKANKLSICKMDSGLSQQWTSYLINNSEHRQVEYGEIQKNSKTSMLAIMGYRRVLKNRGVGNISFIQLNTAYIDKDYKLLHNLLQQLFLEIINDGKFKIVLDKIGKKEDGLLILYNNHRNDTGLRILNIAMTL